MSVLEQFAEDIWVANGPVVKSFGFRYPTRMAIIRLGSGGLFVWSPVALSEPLLREIEEIGPVDVLIAPNSLHYVFIAEWKRAYPHAKVFAAPGLAGKIKAVPLDGELSETPDALWRGEIDQVPVRGNLITTEVVFFHRRSRTAIFTDLLQNFTPEWFSGWRRVVARLDGMISAEAKMPRKFKLAFRDRAAARRDLSIILDWPAERVLMAHGTPVLTNGREALARAFSWLR
jgi:hypothetical protein